MKNAIPLPTKSNPNRDELSHISPNGTWLNPSITSIEQLKDWILIKLGYPLQSVELSPEQLDVCIHDGISLYSKYAYVPERYLILNLNKYEPGKGIDLHEFKVMSVKSIALQRDHMFGMYGDSFFGPYAFLGQGQSFPFFNGGSGNWVGSWTTFHNANEFFQLSKEMCGNNPDFFYDKLTQRIVLMPEPRGSTLGQFILLTCQCEPPIEDYYGNEYCRRLILAEAKILLGTIRKKFSGVNLPGGGQIDTSIGDEGREEKSQALEDLMSSEAKGQCFIVC